MKKAVRPGPASLSASTRRRASHGRARVLAKLQSMLCESGDSARPENFDFDAWVDTWMQSPLPEIEGRTPEEEMRRRDGWSRVEMLLERMRGGVVA